MAGEKSKEAGGALLHLVAQHPKGVVVLICALIDADFFGAFGRHSGVTLLEAGGAALVILATLLWPHKGTIWKGTPRKIQTSILVLAPIFILYFLTSGAWRWGSEVGYVAVLVAAAQLSRWVKDRWPDVHKRAVKKADSSLMRTVDKPKHAHWAEKAKDVEAVSKPADDLGERASIGWFEPTKLL